MLEERASPEEMTSQRAFDSGQAGKPAIRQPILEARGLKLEADGKRLIDGIDLTLYPAFLTVIMGPNGSGKTLLLRLLHGMIDPDAGSVCWNGVPMTREVRRRQAMVFQKPVLLRRSVAANIDFVLGLRGTAKRADRDRILSRVGLLQHAKQPARLLSGGEQQRLALARALALDPEVLFLDEPTASLDSASLLMIENIVMRAHQGGTKIILVTHDAGQARRLADEVVFLHRGKLSEHTPSERFFRRPDTEAAQAYLEGRVVL